MPAVSRFSRMALRSGSSEKRKSNGTPIGQMSTKTMAMIMMSR